MKIIITLLTLVLSQTAAAGISCGKILNYKNSSTSVSEILEAEYENSTGTPGEFFDKTYRGEATLKDLQTFMYKTELLNADARFDRLEDKLVMGKVLEHFLGESSHSFYARSERIDSRVTEGNVEKNLTELFPNDVILKPRSEAGSGGVNVIFGYKNVAKFISENKSNNISKDYFLQASAPRIEKINTLKEYRVHSVWNKVIRRGSLNRWSLVTLPGSTKNVENFLQSFLDALPKGLTRRHAWSFDIIEVGRGEFRIVDINTAGSHLGNWSGFLQNPILLSKMTNHLRKEFDWKFPGLEGFKLKNNLGNSKKVKSKIKLMYKKHGIFIKPAQ